MGKIIKVSGPLVVADGLADAGMADVVKVGAQGLKGEILTMTGDTASIQVYEETAGLGPGAEVYTTGAPLSVELGPGMLENIYDGIQRPLPEIRDVAGSTITRGIEVPALNRAREWHFDPVVEAGAKVIGVNCRDLKTFRTDPAITAELIREIPDGIVKIAESGLRCADDLRLLRAAGADGFLIGETLMREEHPGQKLKELMK